MILVAVLGVLLLAALIVPYFLDVDRYRPTIASAIELQTGRSVSLGKIRARLIPQVGFVVQDFHLGNPRGFPAGDVASADEIRGNLAVGPLLHGTIHLNSLDLVHPKVTLVSDETGKNNYTFGTSPSAQKTAANAGASKPGASSSVISLDQIDNINLTNAEVLLGGMVRGKFTPTADAKNISVTLNNFVISSMSVHELQAESKLSGVTLALGGWNAPIEFHSGQLKLAGGKLDAQFVADLAKASDIKGTLSVPNVEKAQVNFEMSASKLDLDALMAAAGSGPGGSSSAANAPSPSPNPNELVARGHINIEKIISKPYTVGPANAEIRVYGNRAELWPITVGMYGGTLQVSSRVDRVTNPARFTANVQMRGLDVAKVLNESPTARGKMGGTGELDLQLLGAMNDSWKTSISGNGKVRRSQRPPAGRESERRDAIVCQAGWSRRRHALQRARRRYQHRRPARFQQTNSSGFTKRCCGSPRQRRVRRVARLPRPDFTRAGRGPGRRIGRRKCSRRRCRRPAGKPRGKNHGSLRARRHYRQAESPTRQRGSEFCPAGFSDHCRSFKPGRNSARYNQFPQGPVQEALTGCPPVPGPILTQLLQACRSSARRRPVPLFEQVPTRRNAPAIYVFSNVRQ